MHKDCKEIQMILMDIYYGEREMRDGIRNHLEQCQECKIYWQDLQEVGETLNLLDISQAENYAGIEKVFARQEKWSLITDLLKFSFIVVVYAIIMVLLFSNIELKYFIYFQGFFYLSLPLFVIPIIYIRQKGDDIHGG